MVKEKFTLLGHDNPFGYPAPVVPVGLVQDQLVAVYATDKVSEITLGEYERQFVRHGEELSRTLQNFNHLEHRMFGFGSKDVEYYPTDDEHLYFLRILEYQKPRLNNPFLRLSLAKATGIPQLAIKELATCGKHLKAISPNILDAWYKAQMSSLDENIRLLEYKHVFPLSFDDLDALFGTEHEKSRNIKTIKKVSYLALCQMHNLEKRKTSAKMRISYKGEFEALTFVNLVRSFMLEVIESVPDATSYKIGVQYLKSLQNLTNRIEGSLSEGRVLEKGHVARALTLHTRFFNEIYERQLSLNFREESWEDVALIATRILRKTKGLPKNVAVDIRAPASLPSYFISYSSADEQFAQLLYSRMKEAGLRVWYPPKAPKNKQRLQKQIEQAIEFCDKVIVVFSENSLSSDWIKEGIRIAQYHEVRENVRKLYPIRLVDDRVIRQWTQYDPQFQRDLATDVREYFIHDFSEWRQQEAFNTAFYQLLIDFLVGSYWHRNK